MESIRGYFKALKWRSLIVAFSAILLGLLFILTPQASADVICYVAGILLLASGIAAVISYLASGRLFGSYALVSGIVLLVAMMGAIVLTLRSRPSVKRQNIAEQVGRKRKDAVELKDVRPGQGI